MKYTTKFRPDREPPKKQKYVSTKQVFKEDKLADILYQCITKDLGLEYIAFEVNHHGLILSHEDLEEISTTLGINFSKVQHKLYSHTEYDSPTLNRLKKKYGDI